MILIQLPKEKKKTKFLYRIENLSSLKTFQIFKVLILASAVEII